MRGLGNLSPQLWVNAARPTLSQEIHDLLRIAFDQLAGISTL
jgi:hypothetical protein